MTDDNKGLEGCLALILTFALMPIAWVWYGFVLMKLWAWLIVPTFHFSALTLVQAISLDLVISFLTHQRTSTDKEKSALEHAIDGLLWVVIYPSITLLSGYIVSHFIQ